MGKSSSYEKMELKKGPWTREEDQTLLAYIEEHGHGSWRALPAKAGLQRCGKSCRLRWTNYLRPDIKRGKFSSQEEKAIIRLHALLGNRWSAIAAHLPKRTDNEIKNYWNTRLKKRLARMGIDPVTHKPKNNPNGSAQSRQAAAVVSHMAQWETARLEAEARLVRESKFLSNKLQLLRKFATPPPPRPPPQPAAAPPCLDVLRVWQASTARGGGLFGSAGSLESPTSTLNFSGNIGTGPTVTAPDDAVPMEKSMSSCKGKMENSAPVGFEGNILDNMYYGYNLSGSLMDIVSINPSCDGYNNMVGANYVRDFEETKNYWNDLLNFVSSPMESPVF